MLDAEHYAHIASRITQGKCMSVPRYPSNGQVETPERHVREQRGRGYVLAGLGYAAAVGTGILLGGPFGEFMATSVEIVPFAILALLAYVGKQRQWVRILAILWLGALLLGLSSVALLLSVARTLAPSATPGGAGELRQSLNQLGAIALWSFLGLFIAAAVLVPRVRSTLARVVPIDPRSSVHAIALSLVTGASVISLGQLVAARGMPPLLELMNYVPEETTGSDADQLLRIVYGLAWMAPGAIVAVGFPAARNLGQALQRLGLVRPSSREVLLAVVLALLMVGGAAALDAGIGQLWARLGWPRTDAAAFERLLGAAISPLGAVLIGVSAGLGEEMVIRGALQPRVGILLSNVFFTSLHAFQYSWDALLSVFLVGLVLGLVRARSNTTASSIVHGVYNFTLVMISALALFN